MTCFSSESKSDSNPEECAETHCHQTKAQVIDLICKHL